MTTPGAELFAAVAAPAPAPRLASPGGGREGAGTVTARAAGRGSGGGAGKAEETGDRSGFPEAPADLATGDVVGTTTTAVVCARFRSQGGTGTTGTGAAPGPVPSVVGVVMLDDVSLAGSAALSTDLGLPCCSPPSSWSSLLFGSLFSILPCEVPPGAAKPEPFPRFLPASFHGRGSFSSHWRHGRESCSCVPCCWASSFCRSLKTRGLLLLPLLSGLLASSSAQAIRP